MNEYKKLKGLLVITFSIYCLFTYVITLFMVFLIIDSPSLAEIIILPLITLSVAISSSIYFGSHSLSRAKRKEEEIIGGRESGKRKDG